MDRTKMAAVQTVTLVDLKIWHMAFADGDRNTMQTIYREILSKVKRVPTLGPE